MKYLLLVVLSAFSLLPLTAQENLQDSLLGTWAGIITQDKGGYASEYKFEMVLTQDGTEIKGRSFVTLDDIHATMELEGEMIGDQSFSFKESGIVDETSLEGMEWCYKSGFLILSRKDGKITLEGPWSGKTKDESACIPGKIVLVRTKPRA